MILTNYSTDKHKAKRPWSTEQTNWSSEVWMHCEFRSCLCIWCRQAEHVQLFLLSHIGPDINRSRKRLIENPKSTSELLCPEVTIVPRKIWHKFHARSHRDSQICPSRKPPSEQASTDLNEGDCSDYSGNARRLPHSLNIDPQSCYGNEDRQKLCRLKEIHNKAGTYQIYESNRIDSQHICPFYFIMKSEQSYWSN